VNLESPVVLVAGAASRDIVGDDPRGWRIGGAVIYGSLALARFGCTVRAVVAADAEAAGASELDVLRSAGVSMAIAPLASGPVFDNVRHVLHSTSDPVPLTALPRCWTSGNDAVLIAPVAGELGDEWAAVAASEPRPLVALGWQGLLRSLAAGEPVTPRAPRESALARVASLVVMSREDAPPRLRPEELRSFLREGATLVWTEGARGGRVLRGHAGPPTRSDRYPAIPSDRLIDPTGAGDVFLAGMLAARLAPDVLPDGSADTTFAAAAASLVVEAPGIAGVPSLDEVRARMARAPSRARRRPSATSSRTSGRPSQA